MKNHEQFYSFAEVYDVAFDFKDISAECDFLTGLYQSINGRPMSSFLDLAAGPALHAIEMGKRGMSSAALDLSKEMVDYGLQKASGENVTLDYRQGDMSAFAWEDKKFDLAGIFMDSTSYLVNNSAVISHLTSVADVLNEDGLYVLEMSHPRDVFSAGKSSETTWEMERDGLWVAVQWGDPATDTFDPINQITTTTARLRFRRKGDKEQELVETAPQRCFTANEFKALVSAEGSFDLVALYGAMKMDVKFSNDKSSWRMIPVLKKKKEKGKKTNGEF